MGTRALSQMSEYDEVVLYTCPRTGPCAELASPGPPGIPTMRYHAWLYAKVTPPASPFDPAAIQPGTAPPPEIGGLPLMGHGDMIIHRRNYEEYLSAFYAGDEGLERLRTFFVDSMSPELLRLFQVPEGVRLRGWWVNEAPEIEDVPWECISLGTSRPPRLSIVRGWPPASVPPLPLLPEQPLTISVIDPGEAAPDSLHTALADLGPAVKVVQAGSKDPHEALCDAARAGVEVVHLIADASVPLGVEGLLDFPGGATLSPAEVATFLRGSRVTVLSLSTPSAPHTDHAGHPTVFHGFARFGRAMGAGPTVVAPLGPIAPRDLESFWRTFYRRFTEVLDVEDALAAATPCPIRVPMVLFLRQRFGRQLSRGEDWFNVPFDGAMPTPAQAGADLAVSSDLLDAATALQQRYAELGVPFPGEDLLTKERERQRVLASYLEHALWREKNR